VLFLAPRRELVFQTCKKLDDVGVQYGLLLSGEDDRRSLFDRVQVGSIDTLISRVLRLKRLHLPRFDLVIVDEAHLVATDARQRLLSLWPSALRVGLTATPTRKDGKALGALFDVLLEPTTVAQLTAAGHLAPARYFSISEPDLAKVRTVAGDFNSRDLDGAMNTNALVGDIVRTWLERAADRRTVVFATSIAHSVALAETFQRAGVAAEHVDASSPPELRAEIFERFSSGATQILTNCMLASLGFDLPALDCVVLARPTKSLALYLQMCGRGLRMAPNKRDCVVIDHSGAVHMHGFATDEREWTLAGDRAVIEREPTTPRERAERKQIDCPECLAVFSGTRTCPSCGYFLAPRGRMVETIEGTLIEIGAGLEAEAVDHMKFFLELRGLGVERGWKPGAAAHRYREKFGAFPPWAWNDMAPLMPTLATRGWIKSRQIAYAKARTKAGVA
jgi:DNA repair protein RadD